jgi:hypothetical protein
MKNEQISKRITLFGLPPRLVGLMLLVLLAVNIFMLNSCRSGRLISSDSPPIATLSDDELRQAYKRAVKDAEIAEPAEISRELTPIVDHNPDLVWQGKRGSSPILVVTWAPSSRYDDNAAGQNTAYEVWVTVAPELKNFCRLLNLSSRNLTLRLEQLLGLPPNAGKTDLVEIWVDPQDLFRPAPDPAISDREAELDFPQSEKFLTVDSNHISWFKETRAKSYSNIGYPWTRLGYTYDWGNPKSEIGLSEFVIKKGALIEIHSVVSVGAYCN